MTYEVISNRNMSEGFQVMFVYVNDITLGLFVPFLLGMIYIVVVAGSYQSEKARFGQGNFPKSMALGGFTIIVLATLMRLVPGLISNKVTLPIVYFVGFLGVLFFLSQKD